MPSKKQEKFIAQKFLNYWNKKNSTTFVIDDNYLNNRRDNENPDIKIRDNKVEINVEITYASDARMAEWQTRTSDKTIEQLEEIIRSYVPKSKQGLITRINGNKVKYASLVKKDLIKFKKDVVGFVGKHLNSSQLQKLGYEVISDIKYSERDSPMFMIGNEESNRHYNSGYLERLESALNREKKDLIKKGKTDAKDTILLIEIGDSLRNEVEYTSIKEDEIEYHCYFVNEYLNLFKDIYIIESEGFEKIYNLCEISNEMYEYVL